MEQGIDGDGKDRRAILRERKGCRGRPLRHKQPANEIIITSERFRPVGAAMRAGEVFRLFRGKDQQIGGAGVERIIIGGGNQNEGYQEDKKEIPIPGLH
jgi:hypothetical protein